MKNIIFLITFSAAIIYAVNGSAQALQQGDVSLGTDIGVVRGTDIFPLSLFGEVAVHDNLSLGLHFQYAKVYDFGNGNDLSSYSAEFRTSFHPGVLFRLPDSLDLYTGVGIRHLSLAMTGETGNKNWLDEKSLNIWAAHVGIRYYFSRHFAGYVESTTETSAKIGFTFKF